MGTVTISVDAGTTGTASKTFNISNVNLGRLAAIYKRRGAGRPMPKATLKKQFDYYIPGSKMISYDKGNHDDMPQAHYDAAAAAGVVDGVDLETTDATDNSGTDTQAVTITVTDVFEGGKIKVFDGVAFNEKPVKYWNGSAWIEKPLKFWNGTAWTLS